MLLAIMRPRTSAVRLDKCRRLRLLLPAVLLVALALVGVAGAAAGDLDPSFGSGGKVLTDVGTERFVVNGADAVAIQTNGKIVAAGGVSGSFVLLRYNRDGSLDQSFGSGGKVLTRFGPANFDHASAVAIQANGKIVAAGGGGGRLELARYNADGSLDPTFGAGGKVVTGFGPLDSGFANAVAIQLNGRIVAAGVTPIAFMRAEFAVARYNRDGSLDPSFGSGGKVLTHFDSPPSIDVAKAVAIQSEGKIVTAGGGTHFALARYDTDGSLDTSFGSGGTLLTDFGPESSSGAGAVAIQPNGAIVVAGAGITSDGSSNFALVRYLGH